MSAPMSLTRKIRLACSLLAGVLALPSAYAEAFSWPPTGSTLQSNIQNFRWDPIEGAQKATLWAGTAADRDAYGRSAAVDGASYHSIGRLPTDGSEVFVTLNWHDGTRWHSEDPEVFIASTMNSISAPAPGSILAGSSAYFRVHSGLNLGSKGSRIRLGTASNSRAYGTAFTGAAVDLPVDGSDVFATFQWHDGRRWRLEEPVRYQAATDEVQGVWGECTEIANIGKKPLFYADMPAIYAAKSSAAVRGGITSIKSRANRLLRDGCASDDDYLVTEQLGVYVSQYEKGLYLWLSADSGPAVVSGSSVGSFSNPAGTGFVRVIQPDAGVKNPIFVGLPSASDASLSITPLYDDKPIKISELRMARNNELVTALRKSRSRGDGLAFVASNGDPRARVTAEIADTFAPAFLHSEGWKSSGHCGSYGWVDATWEIDDGVIIKNGTVWVDFNHATNDQINAAIRKSMLHPNWYCTPASEAVIEQDWLGKAAATLNGTYDGAELIID